MTRATSNLVWALGLLVAALVLANKEHNPLPWAVAALGIIVLLGSMLGVAQDNAQDKAKATRTTTSTPGATDTP